jgi:hypothetical protein
LRPCCVTALCKLRDQRYGGERYAVGLKVRLTLHRRDHRRIGLSVVFVWGGRPAFGRTTAPFSHIRKRIVVPIT